MSKKGRDSWDGSSVKDEVSYSALIYNQIMRCLESSRGMLTRGIAHAWKSYDDYADDVDHLISLLTLISDDEFEEELREIDVKYSNVSFDEFFDLVRKLERNKINLNEFERCIRNRFLSSEIMYRKTEYRNEIRSSVEKATSMWFDDYYQSHNQDVLKRYSYERFNACLKLLKRRGVIIEKLLEGML